MKLADRLIQKVYENLPKNAKLGKKYNKVVVDGETFKNATLKNINPNKAELMFATSDGEHTFNYIEQEIKLS